MTCDDCTKAATEYAWGGYCKDCPGCTARTIATAPPHARTTLLSMIEAEKGPEAAQEMLKAAREWHKTLRCIQKSAG